MKIMKSLTRGIKAGLCSLLLLLPCSGFSQSPQDQVRVATHECPPFVVNEGGELSGLSVLLWEKIARQLNVEYSIEQLDLKGVLAAVSEGSADIGVSCISITEEREKMMDFSHSYYETHLAIAAKQQGYLSAIMGILTNKKLLIGVGIVLLSAAIIGGILFLLEHNINEKLYSMESFTGKSIEAFILGLLFVVRGPIRYYEFKTLTARILAAVLAVISTFFIASITAALASAFTIDHFSSKITGPQDLYKVRVGAKEASTSSEYLDRNKIGHFRYDSMETLLAALDQGKIDAVVADGALLKFLIKKGKENGNYETLSVLPFSFEKQNYGLALIENSTHLEELNQALLNVRRSKEWKQALFDYFNE